MRFGESTNALEPRRPVTAPTARSRLFALGMLLVYLASVPVLGLLWVSVAYRRFPQIGFRDQL